MRLLLRLILPIIANAAGILAAARWIPGFSVNLEFRNILALALVLAVLNLILRPVLKLMIGPLIVITLGAGVILVNVFILKFLDFLAPGLTIQGFEPLILATLLLSVLNVVLNLIFRI